MASRVESLFGSRGELVPPLHLRWSYYRTAKREGYRNFARDAAIELVSRGLEPYHCVLDVGCGIGPLAIGLIPHLEHGSYEGFDIHPEAVAWCRKAITAKHPQFRFQLADLRNTAYNPHGRTPASEYKFPYPDATFHFAFLGSVATHQPLHEIAHYLKELSRVLKPGGKCIISYYLLHADSLKGIAEGKSFLPFNHGFGTQGSKVVDPANPDLAIAHPEETIRRLYAEAGLRIEEPIRLGRWWDSFAHQQDVVTGVKG
jgi:SAM-dependent methyltransferase